MTTNSNSGLLYKLPFAVCLFLMAAAQLWVVFNYEINWDEFLMLDWVYDWRDGETSLPFQTIYLRFFSWLPSISDLETDQIITARAIMLGCMGLICFSLYGISKRFFSTNAALAAVIAYLSFTFVFRHGTSFRMDTIVTTILMLALYCVTTQDMKVRHILFTSFAIGLAGMVNIKAVFYVPIFAVILLARWIYSTTSRRSFFEGLAIGVLSLVSFAGLYFFNLSSLNETQSGSGYISDVVSISLLDSGFFPSHIYILKGLSQNLGYWLFILIGLFFGFKLIRSKTDRFKGIVILAFGIPLLSLIFYLHGFPYFYTFLLAPVSVLIAAAFDGLRSENKGVFLLPLMLMLSLSYLSVFKRSLHQSNDYQKQIVKTVHKIFPEPVNYIDRCGMISSYGQSWFFMANWKMVGYYATKTPNAKTVLEQNQPAFILANTKSLDLKRLHGQKVSKQLLPEDETLCKQHYIHHWGPIYVPGKNLRLTSAATHFDIVVEGAYTLESDGPVRINNKKYEPGAFIELNKGNHAITADAHSVVTLRFGENLYSPDYSPKRKRVFTPF